MKADDGQPAEELVAVAVISRPRGNRGEVLAELLTESPERFQSLERVTLQASDGREFAAVIGGYWVHAGRLVLKFDGYDSISAAETLRNAFVLIEKSQRISLDEHTFFVDELKGCRVETVSQVVLGSVSEIQPTGGTDVLKIVSDSGKEYLVPFAGSICREVSVESKRIVVDPPDGLLDL